MSQFYALKVASITKETNDTVSVGFEIPSDLKAIFQFKAGQYLTLGFTLNGKDERRAYSLCSSPSESELKVAVKAVANGVVSTHINQYLKAGDLVNVMPPQGNFILEPNGMSKKYVAFAAGSGITPILSMAKTIVEKEPSSTFHIIYSNKDENNVIFKSTFDSLPSETIKTTYVYSRQKTGNNDTEGRIDENKSRQLVSSLNLKDASAFYLCGPEEMIINAKKGIESLGVSVDKIKFELFTTPVLMAQETKSSASVGTFKGTAKVTVIYDDEEITFSLHTDGDSILDTAIKNGVDVPFSCKGAVCCTCKAKVTEGSASMDANYALTDKEVDQGYVLTCTSHPTSEHVIINYDEA
jgi:ring-1,2-phenylacetyl-CoA epoxidase subunit PaaE